MDDASEILALPAKEDLRRQLLAWFARIKRDLPWRGSDDLYGIWVSEIMLQQTTVAAVVPFWRNFMASFPTVQALAAADEAEVLTAWSGLGYYTRARNLHRAAKWVCDELGGALPCNRDQWQALPGVGPYAAGAIASIGLNECVPAMDANARRVIQRWTTQDPVALAKLAPTARLRLVDEFGAGLVPCDQPAAWNESLMELGALVCGAKHAACDRCPVAEYCAAHAGEWIDAVPPPKVKTKSQAVWLGLLLVSWRDHILLRPPLSSPLAVEFAQRKVAREDFSGLHRGLWSLPATVWLRGHDVPPPPTLHWLKDLKLPPKLIAKIRPPSLLGQVRHAITTYRLNVSVYECVLDAQVELPDHWRGGGDGLLANHHKGGVFFAMKNSAPPISQLTRKAWQVQRDSFD